MKKKLLYILLPITLLVGSFVTFFATNLLMSDNYPLEITYGQFRKKANEFILHWRGW